MMRRIAEASPRLKARVAGFYLLAVLTPYNVIAGFLGEGLLMLWLLLIGVNGQRWNAQASAQAESPS